MYGEWLWRHNRNAQTCELYQNPGLIEPRPSQVQPYPLQKIALPHRKTSPITTTNPLRNGQGASSMPAQGQAWRDQGQ